MKARNERTTRHPDRTNRRRNTESPPAHNKWTLGDVAVQFIAACLILVVAGGFLAPVTAAAAYYESSVFTDLSPQSAMYLGVAAAKRYRVVNGYSDGSFHPDASVTVGQFARMLANMYVNVGGYPSATSEDDLSILGGCNFVNARATSLGKGAYAAPLLQYPDKPASREDAATLIYSCAATTSATSATTTHFADTNATLAALIEAVNGGPEKVVIGGYTDGSFRPQNGLTRAQAATMLGRYLLNFILRDVAADITSGRYSPSQFSVYKNDPSSATGLLLTALNNGWKFYSSNPLTGADEDPGIASLVREHPYAMSLSLTRGGSLPFEFLTIWLEPDGSYTVYSYEKYTDSATQAETEIVRQPSDFDGVHGLVRTAAPTAPANSGGSDADTPSTTSRPTPSDKNSGTNGNASGSGAANGNGGTASGDTSGGVSGSRSNNGGSVVTGGTPVDDGAPIQRDTSGLGGINPGDNDNQDAGDWFNPADIL